MRALTPLSHKEGPSGAAGGDQARPGPSPLALPGHLSLVWCHMCLG